MCIRDRNYDLYVENRLWVLSQLALVTGAKVLRDEREYRDLGWPSPAFTDSVTRLKQPLGTSLSPARG